jgi:hypothetical protein
MPTTPLGRYVAIRFKNLANGFLLDEVGGPFVIGGTVCAPNNAVAAANSFLVQLVRSDYLTARDLLSPWHSSPELAKCGSRCRVPFRLADVLYDSAYSPRV